MQIKKNISLIKNKYKSKRNGQFSKSIEFGQNIDKKQKCYVRSGMMNNDIKTLKFEGEENQNENMKKYIRDISNQSRILKLQKQFVENRDYDRPKLKLVKDKSITLRLD